MSVRAAGIGDLDALVRDLDLAPHRARGAIDRVFNRAGVEMKRKMQADFRSDSRQYFRHVARSVNYDYNRQGLSLEVGPNASLDPSAALAGIAYFGGANGGGGTVREPDYILEEEQEAAAEWMDRELRDLL